MASTTQRDMLLLGGGALALWLLMSGKGNALADGSADGSADSEPWDEDWPAWDEALQLDVTPDVPPVPVDDTRERGAEGGIVVSAPMRRPGSPGEVRAAYGREPTDEELLQFERWARENREAADVIHQREAGGASTTKPAKKTAVANRSSGQKTPKKATSSASAAGAATAAKLAAEAASKTPPAVAVKQAQGNQVSSALRALVAPSKASAQAPRAVATKAKPVPATKPTAKPATKPKPKAATKAKPATKRVPAPAGVNLALAKQTAADVAKHIRTKGKKYTNAVVKQFQQRCGLKADGLYGPVTASALRYFGANAPAPLFAGVNAKYVPPT